MSLSPVWPRNPSKEQTERDYRNFALKMLTYLNNPDASRKDSAEIPLENIFRLMEMYRYGAYADGPPRGWHVDIVIALDKARREAFGDDLSQEDVACAVQQGLRDLHPAGFVSDESLAEKMRVFLLPFTPRFPVIS